MITPHPTWDIKDSSKLDTWLDCPRQYFFTYMMGWRIAQPAHDLYFGECWHRAREHQLLHGYADIAGAYSSFITHYRKVFDPESDNIYRPKDPVAVMLALQKFADERRSDLEDNELLFTEISGTVPIDTKGRVLHYRMDSVLRRKSDDKIFSFDHKSAKSFPRQWSEKFFLSIQNGTYTHCLYCLYPIDQVIGIEFCGTKFSYAKRKDEYSIEFQRVPAWKTPDQMNVWLWSVIDMLDNIERETDRLMDCKEGDAVMMSFPMNTNSCTKYYGCAFHDYCMCWSNPLRYCDEPPLGFKIEYWDPSAMQTTNKMNLEWKE